MRKNNFCIKLLSVIIVTTLLMTTCPYFTLPAKASQDPYEDGFNPHDAIAYAVAYAEQEQSLNKITDENGGDCTYFVSKCLSAGGLPMDDNKWNDDDTWSLFGGYTNAYNTFTNVDLLRNYLSNEKHYTVQSFEYSFDGDLPYLPSAGDIIQIDANLNDGIANHSALCIGYRKDDNNNLKLSVAQHSPNKIVSFDELLSWYEHYGTIKIYYIRMTDTSGLVDVTNQYIDKYITIRSLEVDQYVSSDTDQDIATVDALANRSAASTLEIFHVEAGDNGEIGLRAIGNKNYLSARIDLDYAFAPIRAAYGQNYDKPQTWESFRIYEKDGIQYIQSQANGKWIQVVADHANHPLKAASKKVSTWERFQIEIVDPASNSSSNATIVNQYFWKSDYNEGWYVGEWNDGQPNGYGRLTYDDFSDGKYYSLDFETYECKALYYEGQFSDGYRYGEGTVVYENGYKDEGTFYGSWQNDKIVFQGKRWLINDQYNGYWPITIIASGTSSSNIEYGSWQSVE